MVQALIQAPVNRRQGFQPAFAKSVCAESTRIGDLRPVRVRLVHAGNRCSAKQLQTGVAHHSLINTKNCFAFASLPPRPQLKALCPAPQDRMLPASFSTTLKLKDALTVQPRLRLQEPLSLSASSAASFQLHLKYFGMILILCTQASLICVAATVQC